MNETMQDECAALATVAARKITMGCSCRGAASALRPSLFTTSIVFAVIIYLLVQSSVTMPTSSPSEQCTPDEAALITASVFELGQHQLHRRGWDSEIHGIIWGSLLGAFAVVIMIWFCVLFCVCGNLDGTRGKKHQRARVGTHEEVSRVIARELRLDNAERLRNFGRAPSTDINFVETQRGREMDPGSSGTTAFEPTAPTQLQPVAPTQLQPVARPKSPPAYVANDPAPLYVSASRNADQVLRYDEVGIEMPGMAFTRFT